MNLEEWARRLRTRSTRRVYTKAVRLFAEFCEVHLDETLTWSIDHAEDRIVDFKEDMLSMGFAGATVKARFAAVVRWFRDHKIRVLVVCRDVPVTKTFLDYLPSREDVQTVLDGLKPYYKVGAALIAFSGLRPVDATSLKFENVKASLGRGDDVLTINKRHQKTQVWYVSFLGPQGLRYLKTLLENRRRRGEEITDDSFIVSYDGKRLTPGALGQAINLSLKKGVGKHPTGERFRRFRTYGLRKFFRRTISRLGDAEAEYFMGHMRGLVSLEATYNGLRDLDPVAIEALKRKYTSLLAELETEVTDVTLKAQIEEKEKRIRSYEDRMDEIQEDQKRLQKFLEKLEEREKD